jgi:lysine-arginine-ornithine-binding protein
MRKAITLIILAAFVVTIFTGCTSAKNVSGTVKGDDGKVVAGATVQISKFSASTDTDGHFIFNNVKPGKYVLKVSADGAEPFSEDVEVTKDGLSKNVTLKFNTLAKIKRSGILRVGSDTTYAPFESIDTKAGKAVGFDVDIANLIAKKLGVKADIMTTDWGGIIPALETHKFDVIISAMTITEDRKKEIDFSIPYYDSGQIIAVRKSNNSIKGPEDLVGKTVGTQMGTTGDFAVQKIKGAIDKTYPDIQLAFADLELGRLDAVVNDLPVTAFYSKGHKDIKLVGKLLTVEHYGIAFRKNDTELRDAVNKILEEIKADGEYDQIYEKWFGKKPEN